jgi:hypothetical protein
MEGSRVRGQSSAIRPNLWYMKKDKLQPIN